MELVTHPHLSQSSLSRSRSRTDRCKTISVGVGVGAGAGLRVMTSDFTTSCYFNGDVFLVTSSSHCRGAIPPPDKQILDTRYKMVHCQYCISVISPVAVTRIVKLHLHFDVKAESSKLGCPAQHVTCDPVSRSVDCLEDVCIGALFSREFIVLFDQSS